MVSIAIIVGSTRPNRNSEAVARWVHEISKRRTDAQVELIDIRDFDLPLLDEPLSAFATALMNREYTQPHTKAWAEKIAAFDGYVFITPEYNHGPSAALKNALDYLYPEWNNKAAGFGGSGATRSIEQLRLVLSELQVATAKERGQSLDSHRLRELYKFQARGDARAARQRNARSIDRMERRDEISANQARKRCGDFLRLNFAVQSQADRSPITTFRLLAAG